MAIVDVRETESSEIADETVVIPPGSDFDVLWTLRCLVAGQPVSQWPSGISPDTLVQLAKRMRNCKSGIIYFGLGLTRHGVPHANVEALLRLVTDLNAHTRFYARRMRIPGDVAGADSVLCWQTGFPFSVNIARGFPRYSPGEYSANAVLERQEVDSCVLVGSEGVSKLSSEAQTYLKKIPTIVLDYPGIETTWTPTLRFTTPVYGIHLPGTAYRMDEVPIPLRNVLPCDPSYSDAAVLQKLTERCTP